MDLLRPAGPSIPRPTWVIDFGVDFGVDFGIGWSVSRMNQPAVRCSSEGYRPAPIAQHTRWFATGRAIPVAQRNPARAVGLLAAELVRFSTTGMSWG
jgi:hypothetical protein